MIRKKAICFWALSAASCLAASACAQMSSPSAGGGEGRAAAAVGEGEVRGVATGESETRLFWGDTHVHTSNSVDAFEAGQTNADIETAYRFARGLPVIHPKTGMRVRISRPLDFIVIADHAEFLGMQERIARGDRDVLATKSGQWLRELFQVTPERVWTEIAKISLAGENQQLIDDLHRPAIINTVWASQVDAADRYNSPGRFTAFVGWEYSPNPIHNGRAVNQHRVVFTPIGGEAAKRFMPFTAYDSLHPEDLWQFLDQTQRRTGAPFIAIPHNSNVSDGQMFSLNDSREQPINANHARDRSRWERVVEVTQIKGTSETHPALSPNDEFADFEIRKTLMGEGEARPDAGSFARPALLRGLALEQKIGANPFAFGLIGSSDAHTGLPDIAESSFLGKSGKDILPSERQEMRLGGMSAWNVSASGMAAVWARENTRQAIFDAFSRREVYGTTGPRISLRVFAGYDFSDSDLESREFARLGYRKGVPMGGNLLPAPPGRVPALMIRALKDPIGANLDRIQVIKGWVDARGRVGERVYDVAWSGSRSIGADGRLPPVGNTIDLSTASYSNSIGSAELVTVWRDPEFHPGERAFYYVRVLEIPTPRHHVYDAVALGKDPGTIPQPYAIQERAYSSPIWYRP